MNMGIRSVNVIVRLFANKFDAVCLKKKKNSVDVGITRTASMA